MVEPWWSTSEVVRDIVTFIERPLTFSHEVKVVVIGSFKIHFEVRVFESWSRMVEDCSSRLISLSLVEDGSKLIFRIQLEHVTGVEKSA